MSRPDFKVEIKDNPPELDKNIKQRYQNIGVDFCNIFYNSETGDSKEAEIIDVDTVVLCVSNNAVTLEDGKGNEIAQITNCIDTNYKRDREDKGNKVLNAMFTSGYGDINLKMLEFDKIIAIDTNTININNEDVSVTTIIQSNQITSKEDRTLYFWVENIEWKRQDVIKKENYAWSVAISLAYTQMEEKNEFLSIGLIVDSDLGNIPLFNSRELPIFEGFYLPDHFTLLYASADTGSEYLPNALIRLCDKYASEKLKEIKEQGQNG